MVVKGAIKLHEELWPQIFHSAIFSMDDEIYCKVYVPRVLNPWLMQYRTIFRNIRVLNQSTARTILRRPISAHMIDVNQPVVPVVKLVFMWTLRWRQMIGSCDIVPEGSLSLKIELTHGGIDRNIWQKLNKTQK